MSGIPLIQNMYPPIVLKRALKKTATAYPVIRPFFERTFSPEEVLFLMFLKSPDIPRAVKAKI